MRNNNSLNGIYNQANDIGLAKKYLLIAINIFFIIVLVPSIFYNLFILADETNNHLFLALFEIILLLLSSYTLFHIIKYKKYIIPAYVDSFIMFMATIAVILTTEGDSYGYAFTIVLGITVYTLLNKKHATILYLFCSLITLFLAIFIFNTDFESLFNISIIIVLPGGILYAFNFSQQVLIEKLEGMSKIDPLTGLFNRKMYYEQLSKEIELSQKNNSSLTILIVDIDFFKKVNDTYGHHIGDEYLKYISNLFLSHIRPSDTLARWGGEEFSVILPNTHKEIAISIGESFIKLLENDIHDKVGKVTISIGMTSYQSEETYNDFFKRADEALYLSKKNGRNRCTYI
ncbi:GGDEF domain-containing protein [Hujiaoplasma nucleasis]|uniref:GGDEF domain-containing protein n=1 Tax=Hujiaoplasma nucleasis TaxID=2725268 RepID=A0A7L6N756_9MOLU|nr:GGDEF domain-containing protein [Hujiaoplasma nucleasis]QLY40389.1 GGDEF domain-containing protein [Hujiaoplasma nucleasis]